MTVYVALSWWDTSYDDGRHIMGVFEDREDARRVIREDADRVKQEYAKLDQSALSGGFWDEEYTDDGETSPDYIYLASGIESCLHGDIYCWEAEPYEVVPKGGSF
jgi:hypothetical protein